VDWNTWQRLYKRLCATYGKAVNGEQCAAYYESLSHLSEALMEQAIARANAVQKSFPKIADLVERCHQIRAAQPYAPGACDVCHGDGWIDVDDRQPYNVPVRYPYVTRCPQCYPRHAA
jgi:hypothetical protein